MSPIPVPYMEKGPRVTGWQHLRLTPDNLGRYFNGTPGNVGVLLGELSGWIVDVDLNHARAVELADTFVPHTAMAWGRESKPRSHRLFRLTRPTDTRKWMSKTAGMIVELWSTGCQTVAPGSTHPSGEEVRWDDDGALALIDPDELIAALDALAGAVQRELGEVEQPPPNPSPIPKTRARANGAGNYGREALRREAAKVASAPEGARNDTLNVAAFNVGTLVGGGEVNRHDAEAVLLDAARSCGLGEQEARNTIRSGIEKRLIHPRQRPAQGVTVTTSPGNHGRNRGNGDDGGKARAILAYVPFAVDVLPEPVGSFIAGAGKAIGCDPSYIALPMLAALASAIGNTYRIGLKRGWLEPAMLWTGIVGESGTMKTPAFKLAMKPIRKAQDQAFKEQAAAMVAWEVDHLRSEAALTEWKRKAAKGRGDAGDPPEKPAPPIARRYVVSDTTTEALAPILLGNPRGVLLARDELTGWVGSFDRYAKSGRGGGDSACWLSMHNGETLTVDRKSGNPPTIHVPFASVSITGGIQPCVLTRAMGPEHHESGMVARLLFAMPPRIIKRWRGCSTGC